PSQRHGDALENAVVELFWTSLRPARVRPCGVTDGCSAEGAAPAAAATAPVRYPFPAGGRARTNGFLPRASNGRGRNASGRPARPGPADTRRTPAGPAGVGLGGGEGPCDRAAATGAGSQRLIPNGIRGALRVEAVAPPTHTGGLPF